MQLLATIALKHLTARKRQSFVSYWDRPWSCFLSAILLTDAGSEKDFIRRLVDNTPHITISRRISLSTKATGDYFVSRCCGRNSKRQTRNRNPRHPGFERVLNGPPHKRRAGITCSDRTSGRKLRWTRSWDYALWNDPCRNSPGFNDLEVYR